MSTLQLSLMLGAALLNAGGSAEVPSRLPSMPAEGAVDVTNFSPTSQPRFLQIDLPPLPSAVAANPATSPNPTRTMRPIITRPPLRGRASLPIHRTIRAQSPTARFPIPLPTRLNIQHTQSTRRITTQRTLSRRASLRIHHTIQALPRKPRPRILPHTCLRTLLLASTRHATTHP